MSLAKVSSHQWEVRHERCDVATYMSQMCQSVPSIKLAFGGVLLALFSGCGPTMDGIQSNGDRPDAAISSDSTRGYDDGLSPPTTGFEFGAREADDNGLAGVNSCGDFQDNNQDGISDCSDPACGRAPLCCLGQISELCCAARPTVGFDFALCTADTLSSCGSEPAVVFDMPPTFHSDGIVFAGLDRDRGFDLGLPVSLRRQRVSLSADVRLATCEGCLDVAALGLVRDGGSLYLAVTINRATNAIRVLHQDRLIAEVPMPSGVTDATLDLLADGTGFVEIGFTSAGLTERLRVFSGQLSRSQADVTARVWGRTEAELDLASRVSSVRLTRSECDVPSAFGATEVLVEPTQMALSSPSVATRGLTLLAYEQGGAVQALELPGALSAVTILSAGEQQYREPELHNIDGSWVLFAIETQGATSRIVRFTSSDEIPSWTSFDAEALEISTPTPRSVSYVEHLGRPTIFVLEESNGARSIRSYRVQEGSEALANQVATRANGSAAGGAVIEAGDAAAFDADEVSGPSAWTSGGLLRITYAGRRGLRWSFGVSASLDNENFHRQDEPILEGLANERLVDPFVSADGSLYFVRTINGLSSILVRRR